MTDTETEKKLRVLSNMELLPDMHLYYLSYLKDTGLNPKVIYDIGACVLHWTKKAKNEVWSGSQFFCFEAMSEPEFLYKEFGVDGYHTGILTNVDNRFVDYYKSVEFPGGNSYYRENPDLAGSHNLYTEDTKFKMRGLTLDTVVTFYNFPLPNFIKMDVQGAELDIIKGATKCMAHADDVILELQNVDYNMGAPKANEVVDYMTSIGYKMIEPAPFCSNGLDGDYHFKRVK